MKINNLENANREPSFTESIIKIFYFSKFNKYIEINSKYTGQLIR